MRYVERSRSRFGTGDGGTADFVGRIEYLGPEPTFMSGYAMATQNVGLTVTEVSSGNVQVGDQLEIELPVYPGLSYVAQGSSGVLALDPGIAAPGTTLAASSDWTGAAWRVASADFVAGGSGTTYAGQRPRRY